MIIADDAHIVFLKYNHFSLLSSSRARLCVYVKVELVLEGGRAFGTGEHPTTALYVTMHAVYVCRCYPPFLLLFRSTGAA